MPEGFCQWRNYEKVPSKVSQFSVLLKPETATLTCHLVVICPKISEKKVKSSIHLFHVFEHGHVLTVATQKSQDADEDHLP